MRKFFVIKCVMRHLFIYRRFTFNDKISIIFPSLLCTQISYLIRSPSNKISYSLELWEKFKIIIQTIVDIPFFQRKIRKACNWKIFKRILVCFHINSSKKIISINNLKRWFYWSFFIYKVIFNERVSPTG